jgi:hypothetical protein
MNKSGWQGVTSTVPAIAQERGLPMLDTNSITEIVPAFTVVLPVGTPIMYSAESSEVIYSTIAARIAAFVRRDPVIRNLIANNPIELYQLELGC